MNIHLNNNQKNAIEFISDPCLILAGAGSGKTKVIINKIVYLINYCKYEPENIVAITFTNKAAYEMKVRIVKELSAHIVKKLTITTFHSFGLRIIQSEIKHLNINLNFSLVNSQEKLQILTKIIDSDLKKNTTLLNNLSFLISSWKNKLITPLQAKINFKGHDNKQLSYYYEAYEKHLKNFNKLDFDDLIFKPTLLLQNNQKIRTYWKNQVQYLLIDEYQDTNISQYQFIKLINSKNFTLVGDDDQSIYSWRGAQPKNLLSLKQDFPTLKIIKLEHNYRSPQIILKAANLLISNNFHIFKKKLYSHFNNGLAIKVIEGCNEIDEVNQIITKIVHHKRVNSAEFKDYAILYRGNYQSKIFEKFFLKNNIPYSISQGNSFFNKREIEIIIDYLKFIINPDDDFYFLKIINKPNRNIGVITIKKIKQLANTLKKSLFSSCLNIDLSNKLKQNSYKSLQQFVLWTQKTNSLIKSKPEKIIQYIKNFIFYEKWLKKTLKDPKKINDSLDNLQTLSNWINDILLGTELFPKMELSEIVLNYISLNQEIHTNKNNENNAIKLMTLHSSKGLEFPFVFITGLEEGILPHHLSIMKNDLDEERRLMYVGITRAKKELFLTFARKRQNFGVTVNCEPSRFLYELPQEDLNWSKNIQQSLKKRIFTSKTQIKHLKNLLHSLKK